MSAFEENLWREVIREYGPDLARAQRPGHRRSRRPRPRLVLGTTAATAALTTALVLLLSGTASPPAFAITGRPDGTVSVVATKQIRITPAQIARFNLALAAIGARTGRTEKLVATASGVEVRCPGAHGPLVRATIRTVSAPPATATSDRSPVVPPGPSAATRRRDQHPVTVVAWRCPVAGS